MSIQESEPTYSSDYFFSPEQDYYSQPMAPYVRKYSENLYQSESSLPEKAVRKTSCDPIDFKVKFKTEICKYWQQQGSCPFQEQCAFAHGSDEIRNKTHLPSNYKTKKCKNFHENGYCYYGKRCQFLHQEANSIGSVDSVKEEPITASTTESEPEKIDLSNSPNKYQIQLENIDKIWDKKSMCFTPNVPLIKCRPRLATFESLTNSNADQALGESPSTIHESIEDLQI